MGQVVDQANLVHWMKLCPRRLFKFPGSRGRSGSAAYEVDIERAWLGTPATLWIRGRAAAQPYGERVRQQSQCVLLASTAPWRSPIDPQALEIAIRERITIRQRERMGTVVHPR
jgi:hypothetical protein